MAQLKYPVDGIFKTIYNQVTAIYDKIVSVIKSGAIYEIEWSHGKIHDGKMFGFCDEILALANNATLDYHIVTSTGSMHLLYSIYGNTEFKVELYEDITTTGNGTAQSIRNRNRTSVLTPLSAIYKTPTGVGALTTKLCMHHEGFAAQTTGRSGSGVRSEEEWILKPSSKYLLRITSLSGGSASMNGDAEIGFYEV